MRYIVDFIDSLLLEEVDQYLQNNNITKIKQFGTFGNVFLVESNNEILINDTVLSVVHDNEEGIQLLTTTVDLVDRSIPTSFEIDNLQNWWKVASVNSIDFDSSTHNHMIRGINSTVYIMDSGIIIDHPEFANSNITLLHSFNDNFTDNRGHGTALSSIIAGGTCSLSNPSLKVVKIFDTTQPTLQSDLVAALDAIYADYNFNGRKASVINISWSIPYNEYINSKIQYLIDQGLYVVASSGNSGQPIGSVTPASIPDVLTIGSYGQDLTPSKFSNYTGESSISYTANDVNHGALDGWAPGESIYAANYQGGYSYILGTSASAAITSAALAYNLDVVVKNDGDLYENLITFINRRLEAFSALTLGRTDLLDLNESKYASSVNKLATFIGTPRKPGLLHRMSVKAGTPSTITFVNPINYKKVSCENLPEYVTINDRGLITINYPEITQLTETLPPIEFNLITRDDSIDLYILTISVWNQNYNTLSEVQASYEGDDPEMNILLAYGPGGCEWYYPGCAEAGCADFSGGAVICSGAKLAECGCN